ncbi:hypothetical protein LR48_Vigan632s000200 [Vigna angularis]|uniref:Uncharacterized protein n=2 Tax=Phaseolus angularis TaxID=3914 RepID=A0A0L9TF75_PHAAN|nr:hypothetical protein LR48_Vigan632s000200 [Vigna angularis]BAU03220.1 hypothetical protein VIGAN_UM045000 [Vigna angularis var. angularis]
MCLCCHESPPHFRFCLLFQRYKISAAFSKARKMKMNHVCAFILNAGHKPLVVRVLPSSKVNQHLISYSP